MKKMLLIATAILGIAAASQSIKSFDIMEQTTSKVNVWDTYVTKKNGNIMHFDIIAPVTIKDTAIIYGYGKEYLKTKGQEGQPLSAKQCRLCHIETLKHTWEQEIEKKGYFIIEMEGCE